MTFEDILNATWAESDARRAQRSFRNLKQEVKDLAPTRGFAKAIAAQRFSLIAEIKTKSPSMGDMSNDAERAAAVAHKEYQAHRLVSAISVLTQATHFGGSPERLRLVHQQTRKPILRKDFIRDDYEVYFSRAIGADAILLMANVVTEPQKFADLHALANSLGLDVLCEIHSESELALLPPTTAICGINSRRFVDQDFTHAKLASRVAKKDLTTELSAFELYDRLPASALKIAESGMNAQNVGSILGKHAFNAALVGTSLLRGGPEQIKPELDRFDEALASARARMAPSAA